MRDLLFVVAQALALTSTLWLFRRRSGCSAGVLVATAAGCVAGALGLVVVLRLPRIIAGTHGLFEGSIAMAYGALGGAALGAAWGAARRGLAVRTTLDALAPALGLMVICGRLGCAVAGCCFGRPFVPGLRYPAGTPVHAEHLTRGLIDPLASSLPVHPAPLYEALVGVGMLAAGLWVRPRRRGGAFAVVTLIYAAGRFALELVRDDPRPFAASLSVAQWLSVMLAALVVVASVDEAQK